MPHTQLGEADDQGGQRITGQGEYAKYTYTKCRIPNAKYLGEADDQGGLRAAGQGEYTKYTLHTSNTKYFISNTLVFGAVYEIHNARPWRG